MPEVIIYKNPAGKKKRVKKRKPAKKKAVAKKIIKKTKKIKTTAKKRIAVIKRTTKRKVAKAKTTIKRKAVRKRKVIKTKRVKRKKAVKKCVTKCKTRKNPLKGSTMKKRKKRRTYKAKRRATRRVKRRTYRRNPVSRTDRDLYQGLAIAGVAGVGTFFLTNKINIQFGTQKVPLQLISLAAVVALLAMMSQKDKTGRLKYAAAGTSGVLLLAVFNSFGRWTGGQGMFTPAFMYKFGSTKDLLPAGTTAGLLNATGRNRNRMYMSGHNATKGLLSANNATGNLLNRNSNSTGNVRNYVGGKQNLRLPGSS